MQPSAMPRKSVSASVKKVFEDYFILIDDYFGSIKHHLGKTEDSHIDLGNRLISHPGISNLVLDSIEDVGSAINKFWVQNKKCVREFSRTTKILKCLYSGDVSPVNLEKFIKKTALYVDTVILPDPLFKLSVFFKPTIRDRKYYLNKLIRHVFNVWKMKDLIMSDAEHPILIPYPISIELITEKDKLQLLENAESKFIQFFNELSGQNFANKEDVLDFLKRIKTTEDFFQRVQRIELLPNLLRKQDDFDTEMNEIMNVGKHFHAIRCSDTNSVENFGMYVYGQFIRTQEHKFYCSEFLAEPIYDYELPWSFLNYDMGGQDIDPVILSALQHEKFEWIGNIPLSAIKILREEGKLEYMRSTLRNGISSIVSRKDHDLSFTIDQLQNNFTEAFERQKCEMKILQAKVNKIVKKNIPIAIVGFLLGFIPGLGNFLSVPFTLKDIFGSYQSVKKELGERKGNNINLLMKAYEE